MQKDGIRIALLTTDVEDVTNLVVGVRKYSLGAELLGIKIVKSLG